MLCSLTLTGLGLTACGNDTTDSGGGATTSSQASAAPRSVRLDIRQFKFTPPTETVAAGGRVTWTNHDSSPHTATASAEAQRASFDTQAVRQGQSRSVTFDKPGRYRYLCVFHPFMVGTVVVN